MNVDARRRVLVADDDPDVRQLVVLHLLRFGFDVLEARDGEEAVRIALEQEPDLLVLDVRMPGLTGYEVTREVRSRLPSNVPVLLISGNVLAADISEGFEAGADAYLKKPFAGEELQEQVQALLA